MGIWEGQLRKLTPPVLVIGGGSANGLGIAWNLGSRGIPIYCVTSSPQELLLVSRCCTGASVLPNVESDAAVLQAFLQRFTRYIAGRSVIFPTTDTALLTVASLQDTLSPYVTWMPDRSIVETMVFKDQFYQSLEQHDVPHPRTIYLDEQDAASRVAKLTFPVFLRPAQSLLFYQRLGGKGFVAHTAQECHHYLNRAQRAGLVMMVQEIIQGPATNGYIIRGYLDKHSQPIVLFATRKVRQPSMFSVNTVKVSIPLAQIKEGVDLLLPYLQDIQYHGLFGAEFKRDPQDGCLKLLEINARTQGGNFFATQCGANDVLAAYRDALGYKVTPVLKYAYGVYAINLAIDGVMLTKRLVTGRLSTQDMTPYRNPHYYVRFASQDPLPFMQSVQTYIRKFFRK